MATLMEKEALMEAVNGAIAKLTRMEIDDDSTRQVLYNLNSALLKNPPEIFDFERTIKMVKSLMEKYKNC